MLINVRLCGSAWHGSQRCENYVIHWPIRWHWENGNQELAYIRGHRLLRAILKTEDTVLPKTDIPGLVNSIFKCL